MTGRQWCSGSGANCYTFTSVHTRRENGRLQARCPLCHRWLIAKPDPDHPTRPSILPHHLPKEPA